MSHKYIYTDDKDFNEGKCYTIDSNRCKTYLYLSICSIAIILLFYISWEICR